MPPDYATIIDAETWAFIERTGGFYPPDAVDLTIAEQRLVYDRMCAAFHAGRPEGVRVSDRMIGALPLRDYSMGSGAALSSTRTDPVSYCEPKSNAAS